jgi:cytochrome c553
MQHHFGQITTLHEALIRGDLKALLVPAAELATADPPVGFPEKGAPFFEAIRQLARRAGTAPNLRTAATEIAVLTGQCATCHQAVGIYPSPASPRRPDLPQIVGHMIEHQRSADDMLQGLIMPSASRWQEAADRLETLVLKPEEWPPSRKLNEEARKADVAVHGMAARARSASTVAERRNLYVDFVMTCAGCHSRGGGAWGPRSVR